MDVVSTWPEDVRSAPVLEDVFDAIAGEVVHDPADETPPGAYEET